MANGITSGLNVNDLALVELLRGEALAPRAVFDKLRAQGYVQFTNGVPKLTAAGRNRAGKLKPAEHDMRMLFTAPVGGSSACAIRAIGGSRLQS